MKDNQFYPTPYEVARIAAGMIQVKGGLLLEPSAGHGDLLAPLEATCGNRFETRCVEIDADNMAVLISLGYNAVCADFLNIELPRIYDAVLMNPPFNSGAKHILKAWGLLKQGGDLVAVINKSALDNDFSADRKLLKDLMDQHGEYNDIGKAFTGDEAERKASVDCAIIHLIKPFNDDEGINTTEGLNKGPEIHIEDKTPEFGLIKADFVSAAEEDYQRGIAEVFKGLENIEKGWGILNSRFGSAYEHGVVALDKIFENTVHAIANKYGEGKDLKKIKEDFVASVRALAWLTVLDKTEVKNLLYSNDQTAFINQVMTDSRGISFTKENIKSFVLNIFMKRKELFNGAVKKLFNELRRYHDGNRNHTEGWKTNKSWKVPEKIILPYGVEFSYSRFNIRYRQDYIDDLDRICRVLDAKNPDYGITIKNKLSDTFCEVNAGKKSYTDEVETEYFTLKFFKKGTLHITFKRRDIMEQINVIGVDGHSDIPNMES